MARPIPAAERADRATAALVAKELADLGGMTGTELAAKFEEVLGFPARTRNKVSLKKRLSWAIQAQIEGGLSDAALKRIEELAAYLPEKWKRALEPGARPTIPAASRQATTVARDRRLPRPGSQFTRVHDGVEHTVTILEKGFEYRGKQYRSLSAVAREITGVAWNGFTFFLGRADGRKRQ